jgi:hypothetical protein
MGYEVDIRPSPAGGLGLFSVRAVPAGVVVREFILGREVTKAAPLRPEAGELPDHCPLIDGRFYLIGAPDRHFNHSCDPNCYKRFSEDHIEVVARRAIAQDEELSFDYLINNPGGDSWPCRCGAARCRGKTGESFFTLPLAFQREYRPLLAEWFIRRHPEETRQLDAAAAGGPTN